MATIIGKTIVYGVAGTLIGAVAGGIGGFYVGQAVNDYVEFLREAPKALQYGVDAVTIVAGGGLGAAIGQVGGMAVGGLVGLLRRIA